MFVDDLDVPDIVKKIVLESGIKELYPPQIEAVKTGFLKGGGGFWLARIQT